MENIKSNPGRIILPVTTRGIGFIVAMLSHKLASLNTKFDIHKFTGSLYRVSLAMFEHKVATATYPQGAWSQGAAKFDLILFISSREIQFYFGGYFVPLYNLISSIGLVRAYESTFIPGMYTRRSVEGVNEYRPTLVRYSNLHEYVVAMNDVATPHDIRFRFFKHNPFPNARWTNDDDVNHPLLLNPDDIAPEEFEKRLQIDICIIGRAMDVIRYTFPECIYNGYIDHKSEGNVSQIVSSQLSDMRNQLTWKEGQPVYSEIQWNGTDNIFWSTEVLTDAEFYSGIQHMLGEVDKDDMCQEDISRTYALSKRQISLSAAISHRIYTQRGHIGLLNGIATPRYIFLPVTTRGIGFMVAMLSHKLFWVNIKPDIHQFTGSLYRVSLAMFEQKVATVMYTTGAWSQRTDVFDELDMDHKMQSTLKIGGNLVPLFNIISSIGLVRAYGVTFVPGMYTRRSVEGVNEYRPTLVRYSNLRDYVVAMNDVATPHDIRLRFFEHNPFPNARWTDDDDVNHPLLLNPDDIAPEEFENRLKDDIRIIENAFPIIGKEFPEYISNGYIDYESEGNVSQIVSSQLSNAKSGITWNEDQPWYTMGIICWGCNEWSKRFWSTEVLKDSEFKCGIQYLMGEVDKDDMCLADMSREYALFKGEIYSSDATSDLIQYKRIMSM